MPHDDHAPSGLAALRVYPPCPTYPPLTASVTPPPALAPDNAPHQEARMYAAQKAWEQHLDAGRIGVPAPPPTGEGDYGLASLAAILGLRHPGGGR